MQTTPCLFLIFTISAVFSGPLPKEYCRKQYLDNPSVQKFQDYIRIDTSREENIEYAVEFWRRQAAKLGLSFSVHRPAGKPICVITWQGEDPALPSIMLNSHMDVVSVAEQDWTYPPFSGEIDENGNIYGRGTQDDKDIAIQYIEAIGRLMKDNVSLKRTLHITLMPDEESGGHNGMLVFRDTEEFNKLNVGFVLDEGISSSDDTLYATYQDKRPWQMEFTVHGSSGHGSSILTDAAMDKLQRLINIINKHRQEQAMLKNSRDATDYGAYDTVNINMIHGGVAANIIPGKMSLVVDVRLSSSANVTETQNMVNSWIEEAGNGTEIEFKRHIMSSGSTAVDDSNPFWMAMQAAARDFENIMRKQACFNFETCRNQMSISGDTGSLSVTLDKRFGNTSEMEIEIKPVVCPAASDMLYLRNRGFPALGFAPKSYTTSRIHGADEYLNVATFLNGIDIYVVIIKKLGNV